MVALSASKLVCEAMSSIMAIISTMRLDVSDSNSTRWLASVTAWATRCMFCAVSLMILPPFSAVELAVSTCWATWAVFSLIPEMPVAISSTAAEMDWVCESTSPISRIIEAFELATSLIDIDKSTLLSSISSAKRLPASLTACSLDAVKKSRRVSSSDMVKT